MSINNIYSKLEKKINELSEQISCLKKEKDEERNSEFKIEMNFDTSSYDIQVPKTLSSVIPGTYEQLVYPFLLKSKNKTGEHINDILNFLHQQGLFVSYKAISSWIFGKVKENTIVRTKPGYVVINPEKIEFFISK